MTQPTTPTPEEQLKIDIKAAIDKAVAAGVEPSAQTLITLVGTTAADAINDQASAKIARNEIAKDKAPK